MWIETQKDKAQDGDCEAQSTHGRNIGFGSPWQIEHGFDLNLPIGSFAAVIFMPSLSFIGASGLGSVTTLTQL
jgi:hypothetical protein